MNKSKPEPEELLQLTGKQLLLSLDPKKGTISIKRKDGKICFSPILFWARYKTEKEKTRFLFSTLLPRSSPQQRKNQASPWGRGTRIIWNLPHSEVNLDWEIVFLPQEDFLCFRLSLENLSPEKILLYELVPFSYRGADEGLEMGGGWTVWKFYTFGYQSWSQAGTFDHRNRQKKPRNFLSKKIAQAPYLWKRNFSHTFHSEWMMEIVETELDLAFLLGFASAQNQLGVVEAEIKYERFRRLEAIADCEGVVLKSGEKIFSDWVLAGFSDAPRRAQKKYFEILGKENLQKESSPQKGWCSWYAFYEKLEQEKIEQNLEIARELKPFIEVFQIDDGYEPAIGDWELKTELGGDLKTLSEQIHEQGLRAGLWLAPFLVSPSSQLYQEHPDWVLRKENGKEVLAMFNPRWKGRIAYALDASHPGFQSWLGELIEYLAKECGFEYLKLDFLYAGALPGKRFNPQLTGAQALRQGLEIIRKSAGKNCYLLACGAPLAPCLGLVDAMRVSQDIDRKWTNPIDWFFGLELAPAFKNCLKNNLARSLSSKRLWTLDPDCLLLKPSQSISEKEIQAELVLFYLLAGQIFLGEDLTQLSEEDKFKLSLVIPVAETPAEPIDLFEREFPQELLWKNKDKSLLALFNWGEKARPCRINLKRYGLKGSYHLFEFFKFEYLGVVEEKAELGWIPPRGVRYFSLTQNNHKPKVVGLDFHLGMGAQGIKIQRRKNNHISLKLNLPGKRKGKIWLALPDKPGRKIIEVEFEDRAVIKV